MKKLSILFILATVACITWSSSGGGNGVAATLADGDKAGNGILGTGSDGLLGEKESGGIAWGDETHGIRGVGGAGNGLLGSKDGGNGIAYLGKESGNGILTSEKDGFLGKDRDGFLGREGHGLTAKDHDGFTYASKGGHG